MLPINKMNPVPFFLFFVAGPFASSCLFRLFLFGSEEGSGLVSDPSAVLSYDCFLFLFLVGFFGTSCSFMTTSSGLFFVLLFLLVSDSSFSFTRFFFFSCLEEGRVGANSSSSFDFLGFFSLREDFLFEAFISSTIKYILTNNGAHWTQYQGLCRLRKAATWFTAAVERAWFLFSIEELQDKQWAVAISNPTGSWPNVNCCRCAYRRIVTMEDSRRKISCASKQSFS